jgi:hypothetical protein
MFNGGFEKGVGFRDCVGFYKKLLNMFNFYRWRLGSSFVAMVVFFFLQDDNDVFGVYIQETIKQPERGCCGPQRRAGCCSLVLCVV